MKMHPKPRLLRCIFILLWALLFVGGCSDESSSSSRTGSDAGSLDALGDTHVSPRTDTTDTAPDTTPDVTDTTDTAPDVSESTCGDGVIEGIEVCDDDNSEGGDGCAADCLEIEAGYVCSSGGGACVELDVCGNGLLESPEVCDDGNTRDGDGCSTDCAAVEQGFICPIAGNPCVPDTCGNNVLNVGEECDDGVLDGSYGACNLDCTFAPFCGDAVLDASFGETCDDGALAGGYAGCRPDCKREPFCGDGIVTHAEVCDDGGADSGDGCDATCVIEAGYVCRDPGSACALDTCGDGIIDEGEGCDDGNRLDGDGCDARCVRVRPGYDCPIPGEDCVSRACGDGIIAGDETCDDGNAGAGDGCSERCKLEAGFICEVPGTPCADAICGNGLLEGLEACDDGNASNGDGCDDICDLEVGFYCPVIAAPCSPTFCGDSLVQGLEACDDGNTSNGDGCDDLCALEDGNACPTPGVACHTTTCGDAILEGTELCDDGNLSAGDGCDPLCRPEPIYDCEGGVCVPVCGDGITLYPFEECDDANTSSGDGCSAACTAEIGWLCTDYTNPTPPTIAVPIVFRDVRGGNESQDSIEDGIFYPDGSSYTGHPDFELFTCDVETTGLINSFLGPDGTPEVLSLSGSGVCNQQITSADTFHSWYHNTSGVNIPIVQTLQLDQRLDLDPAGRTYRFDDSSFFPLDDLGYGQSNPDHTGHNFAFTSEFRAYFEYRGGETLDFTGDDDVWVFINKQLAVDLGGLHPPRSGSVTLSSAVDAGTGQITDDRFDIYEGGIYEIAFFHAERHATGSNFRLTLAGFVNTGTTLCEAVCGDSILAGTEQCDDGNPDNGDGCSADCMIEPFYYCDGEPSVCIEPPCGDGLLEFPEECDDGGLDNGDGCSSNCQLENCGDGNLDPGEVCDDGNNIATDACTNACQPAICGDHVVLEGVETCDDGNDVETDTCNNSCLRPFCGDGVVGVGEQCDDGLNGGAYGSCTPDCGPPIAYCGDGVVQPAFEKCDDGINDGTYGTCNPDCTLPPACGDGSLDPEYGEECDDANLIYGDGCDGACEIETNYFCTDEPGATSFCQPIF